MPTVVAMVTPGDAGTAAYGFAAALKFGLVGMIVGFLLSFRFTPVAAQAIAIVGVNPVSGMTLITVVLAIGALILVGLKGDVGMIVSFADSARIVQTFTYNRRLLRHKLSEIEPTQRNSSLIEAFHALVERGNCPAAGRVHRAERPAGQGGRECRMPMGRARSRATSISNWRSTGVKSAAAKMAFPS